MQTLEHRTRDEKIVSLILRKLSIQKNLMVLEIGEKRRLLKAELKSIESEIFVLEAFVVR